MALTRHVCWAPMGSRVRGCWRQCTPLRHFSIDDTTAVPRGFTRTPVCSTQTVADHSARRPNQSTTTHSTHANWSLLCTVALWASVGPLTIKMVELCYRHHERPLVAWIWRLCSGRGDTSKASASGAPIVNGVSRMCEVFILWNSTKMQQNEVAASTESLQDHPESDDW